MAPYISASLFRRMGTGADVSAMADDEIDFQMAQASQMVNRWCNKQVDFDFRGGDVTGEEHVWDTGNAHVRRMPVIYPRMKPLITLDLFNIRVSTTQYISVDPKYTIYDRSRNQIQSVALATVGPNIWTAEAIPNVGLVTPLAVIDYSYGYRFTTTERATYDSTDGSTKTWHVTNQWWYVHLDEDTGDPDNLVVKVNGMVALPTAEYTWDTDRGTVTFTASLAATDNVDVTYTFTLPKAVQQATAVVFTDLLGAKGIVEAGLLGLSGIKAEEIELRQSRDTRIAAGDISDRAKALLAPFREVFWA